MTYSSYSPYYKTEMYANALDVMTDRQISKYVDDVEYYISSAYNLRPDLLAYDLYGSSDLWWVFAARNPNILFDPLMDFKAGTKIYLPKKERLLVDLGI